MESTGTVRGALARDVLAAVNIGCRFLASALNLPLGRWARGSGKVENIPSLSWADIFAHNEHRVPFSIPVAKLP